MRHLDRAVTALAVAGFIVMLLVTGAQVAFRKLSISVDWTEEAARALFILTMFFGIAIAIRERQHIVVDFLFNRLSPRAQALGRIVFNILILLLLISLLRGAAAMAVVTWESFMIAMSWLRTGHLFLGECLAIALMMLYVARDTVRHFGVLFGQAKAVPEPPR